MGRARYLAVNAVAAVLVGCGGGDDEPDVAVVERDLARAVEQQTGTRDVQVDCPDDVAEDDLCRVSAAGGVSAQVRVTSLGDEAEGEIVRP